jgi:hypothetical protein
MGDWRFKDFKDPGGGAYNRTLAIDTPQSRAQFNAGSAGTVNASQRISNPTNTDWNATFGRNAPQSPSGTDWGNSFDLSPRSDEPQLRLGSSPLVPDDHEIPDMSKQQALYGWPTTV